MPLFQIKDQLLNKVKEKKIDLEKDVQALTENNLGEIYGLEYVTSEFILENFRIDTLAFDPQAQSFVVIEYKRDQSFSIIDQGVSYLNTILRNKAELILEYNEKTTKSLNRKDINWGQLRVIFVAQRFTPHQQNTVGFKNFPIELWEVKIYENGSILYNQIKPPEVKEDLTSIAKGEIVEKVTREVTQVTLEDHYKKMSESIKKLFYNLREEILSIDNGIIEKPVGSYVGYKMSWYNFVSVHTYQNKLRVTVRKEKVNSDVKRKFTKIPESYAWGKTPLWWIDISNDSDLPYVLKVVEESYKAAPDK